MTTPEFLHLLEEIRDQYDWTLTPDTAQYSERRAQPRLVLLATRKDMPEVRIGPLQAVCLSRTGKPLSVDSVADAAEVLRMDRREVRAIMAAASDNTWEGKEGERTPVAYLDTLRRELLQAVGTIRHVAQDSPDEQFSTNRTPHGLQHVRVRGELISPDGHSLFTDLKACQDGLDRYCSCPDGLPCEVVLQELRDDLYDYEVRVTRPFPSNSLPEGWRQVPSETGACYVRSFSSPTAFDIAWAVEQLIELPVNT